MLRLNLTRPDSDPPRLLVIGAHADDIEIGCGATILRLVAKHPGLSVDWLVLSGHGERAGEAADSAAAFLAGATQGHDRALPGRLHPLPRGAVKERFEQLKAEVAPDLVLTHRLGGPPQDHRLAAEQTWNTFRDHLVLEYEIPKSRGRPRPPEPVRPGHPGAGCAQGRVAALPAATPRCSRPASWRCDTRWNVARNGHAVPIPGFRTTALVEENAAAMAFGPLTTARMTEIARLPDRFGGARSSPGPYA